MGQMLTVIVIFMTITLSVPIVTFAQEGIAARVAALEDAVSTLQAQVDALQGLEQRVADLEAKLTCMTKVENDVFFEGCNVHVRDGSGDTYGSVNGLGNMIIGYNEDVSAARNRTGSHNLVIGPEHSYTSFGGFVAGRENTISGEHASVSGGSLNEASGLAASVSGGGGLDVDGNPAGNTASGDFASVSGGQKNLAGPNPTDNECDLPNVTDQTGLAASVSGGHFNTACAVWSNVSGGVGNFANGGESSVSGGENNKAQGTESSVSGGVDITATEQNQWCAGNESNCIPSFP